MARRVLRRQGEGYAAGMREAVFSEAAKEGKKGPAAHKVELFTLRLCFRLPGSHARMEQADSGSIHRGRTPPRDTPERMELFMASTPGRQDGAPGRRPSGSSGKGSEVH